MKLRNLQNKDGFTLVELILVISLIGIIFFVSSIILFRSLDAYQFVTERTTVLERARFAVDRMTREFQLLSEGEITNVSSTSINFIDDQALSTDFSLSGTNLLRGNDVLCADVTSFTLTYFNAVGSVTSSANQVRRIRLDLTVAGGGTAGTTHLRAEAYLRGLMYEGYY